ncbi:MAG: D-aminoacyl-tRNA deacylase [Anaerolineaceae bacterium]|nr:D-aminoacyl-tRNA deacylase [Anaerolineaceae bacterium]
MRAVIQRVTKGQVVINNKAVASIRLGFVILLGVEKTDNRDKADALAKKISNLRVFSDDAGKMNLSILDVHGKAIVVSQFTLMADTRKGNRPSFIDAALPEMARPLVDYFIKTLGKLGVETQSGEFGADMLVEIQNDGPVTILLDF